MIVVTDGGGCDDSRDRCWWLCGSSQCGGNKRVAMLSWHAIATWRGLKY